MSDHENEPVKLIVNVLPGNIRRLEGVAAVNGESPTDAVNRALHFYETICTAPVGRVLTWEDGNGEKRMLLIADPGWVTVRLTWWERILGFFFVRVEKPSNG